MAKWPNRIRDTFSIPPYNHSPTWPYKLLSGGRVSKGIHFWEAPTPFKQVLHTGFLVHKCSTKPWRTKQFQGMANDSTILVEEDQKTHDCKLTTYKSYQNITTYISYTTITKLNRMHILKYSLHVVRISRFAKMVSPKKSSHLYLVIVYI